MSIPPQAASYLGLLIGKVAFQAGRCLRNPGAGEVHDVRVSIRRLQQALRVFKTWMPDNQPRKIRGRLKGILKTAGSVRDYDIALQVVDAAGLELSAELRTALGSSRETAAAHLANALTRLMESGFTAKWRSRLELDSAGRDSGDAMKTLARGVLPGLAAAFIDAGALLAGRPKSKRRLHAFRLSAKRFRYSLEPFAALYGTPMNSRLKAVRKVQDVLGKLSDAAATRRILKGLGAPPEALDRLRKEEAARLAEFRESWPKLFGGTAQEKWKRFLQGTAPRGKRKAAKVAR